MSTGGDDAYSSTAACPTTDDDTTEQATAKNALPVDGCFPPPNSSNETEEQKKGRLPRDAERNGESFEEVEAGSTDKPRFSCALPCHRQRQRAIASRARICGLLVERGARRSWRRAPSEQQVTLEKKYAALLEDDDGRNLCTFSG